MSADPFFAHRSRSPNAPAVNCASNSAQRILSPRAHKAANSGNTPNGKLPTKEELNSLLQYWNKRSKRLVAEKSLLESKIQSRIAARKSSKDVRRVVLNDNKRIQNAAHGKHGAKAPTNIHKKPHKLHANLLKHKQNKSEGSKLGSSVRAKRSHNSSLVSLNNMKTLKSVKPGKGRNKWKLCFIPLSVFVIITV